MCNPVNTQPCIGACGAHTNNLVQPCTHPSTASGSDTDSTERAPPPRPPPPPPDATPPRLSGIRHRLLAHCFRKAAAAGPHELRRLFFGFDGLSSLLMLRVQFLDADHLLLSMGKAQHWLGRGGDGTPRSAGLLVYSWREGTVVDYIAPKDQQLARLCVQYPAWFAPDLGDSTWLRCVSPGVLPYAQRQAALLAVRGLQAGGGSTGMQPQVCVRFVLCFVLVFCYVSFVCHLCDGKRVLLVSMLLSWSVLFATQRPFFPALPASTVFQDCEAVVAALPATCQQHQASPYLDPQLFQVRCMEQPSPPSPPSHAV